MILEIDQTCVKCLESNQRSLTVNLGMIKTGYYGEYTTQEQNTKKDGVLQACLHRHRNRKLDVNLCCQYTLPENT